MIDKSKIRTLALLGKLEKNGIDRDIATSKLLVQEYLFKKLFIRSLILFLISFVIIFTFNFDDFIMSRSIMSKEYFINNFTFYILSAMIVCFIYDLILGFVLINEYKNIKNRADRYLRGIESVRQRYEEE